MNKTQTPEVVGADSKSIKDMAVGFYESIKGPIFWTAIGYTVCKFMDRKKKRVID